MTWLIGFIISVLYTVVFLIYFVYISKHVAYLFLTIFFIVADILLFRKYWLKKHPEAYRKSIRISSVVIKADHISGLPLSNGTGCTIRYKDDCVKISGGGINFELKKEKITDIHLKSDVDIHRMYVSSVGRAAAGRAVFGEIGEMVGGRARQRTIRQYRQYLIFTYLTNEGIAYICFKIWDFYFGKAVKLKEYLQGQLATGTSIEL